LWFNPLEPPICHREAAGQPRASIIEDGRVDGVLSTWARRMPSGSIAFVVPDVGGVGHKAPARAHVLDCDTYTASIYVGHYGLRQLLRWRPNARWYMVGDDDLYVNPQALSSYLRELDADATLCAGARERADRPLLSYWSGIVCTRSAVELLDLHLEGALRQTVQMTLGYSAGDFIISKCLWDLGVPMVDLSSKGYFDPHWKRGAPSKVAATFHPAKMRHEFELLDRQLFSA